MGIVESNSGNSDTILSSKKSSKESSSIIEMNDFDSFAKKNGTKIISESEFLSWRK